MRFGNRRRVSTNVSTWLPTRYGPNGPDNTRHYVPIIIQASQVSSALTDFPVYVDLSTLPSAFWANVQSDGGDIRVATAAGVQVPAELVSINTGSETGELHFLASSVSSSSNTEFRIYYDAETTLSQPGVATTYGRNAVWSDYTYVFHEGTTDSAATSSLSLTGATSTTSNARLGDESYDFDGSGDYARVASSTGFYAKDAQFSFWFRHDVPGESDIWGLLWKAPTTGFDRYISISVSGGNVLAQIGDGSSNLSQVVTSGVDYRDQTWHYATLVYEDEGSTLAARLYVDGVEKDSATGFPYPSAASSANFEFGRVSVNSQSGRYLNGGMDELRIRESFKSAAFIASEYTNQNTPSAFYNVGSQANA